MLFLLVFVCELIINMCCEFMNGLLFERNFMVKTITLTLETKWGE